MAGLRGSGGRPPHSLAAVPRPEGGALSRHGPRPIVPASRRGGPPTMLSFAAAVFFLIVTPGPGVLTTAGVGAAFGGRAGVRYVMGLFIGTNIVALAVISGVAAVV